MLTALQLATLPAIRDVQPWFSSFANTKFNPIQPNRPMTSSMSSTVKSFSGPKVVSNPISRVKIVNPVAPDDCHSDYDSSSLVVDDDNDNYCVLSPRFVRSSRSIWIYLLWWMKILASLMIFKPPLCVSDCGSNGQLFFFFYFLFFLSYFLGKMIKKKKIVPVVERWREIGFFCFFVFFKSFSVLDYNSYGVE